MKSKRKPTFRAPCKHCGDKVTLRKTGKYWHSYNSNGTLHRESTCAKAFVKCKFCPLPMKWGFDEEGHDLALNPDGTRHICKNKNQLYRDEQRESGSLCDLF